MKKSENDNLYNEKLKSKVKAYKDCMDLLRHMADEKEKKGAASEADALREARALINLRHDSVFRNLPFDQISNGNKKD